MTTIDTAYNRTLKAWAKDFQEKNVTADIQRLINQANFDLYYGPIEANTDEVSDTDDWSGYPGFTTACKRISEAVSVPSVLYIDCETETYQTDEPETQEMCVGCEGNGTYTTEDHETFKCDSCDGRGSFDCAGDWWKVETRDLKTIIFGKELVQYI